MEYGKAVELLLADIENVGIGKTSKSCGISQTTLLKIKRGATAARLDVRRKIMANAEKRRSEPTPPEPAVPAWDLEGEDLRCAVSTEWDERSRESGLAANVPGGLPEIESYISGGECSRDTLMALRRLMGFEKPVEPE